MRWTLLINKPNSLCFPCSLHPPVQSPQSEHSCHSLQKYLSSPVESNRPFDAPFPTSFMIISWLENHVFYTFQPEEFLGQHPIGDQINTIQLCLPTYSTISEQTSQLLRVRPYTKAHYWNHSLFPYGFPQPLLLPHICIYCWGSSSCCRCR